MFTPRLSLLSLFILTALLLMTACRTAAPPPPLPPRPTVPPAPPQAALPPSATMSLRDYLKKQLGPDFHLRAEWAGTGLDYAPQVHVGRIWAPIGNVKAVTIHHAEMQAWSDTAAMIRGIFRGHTRPDGRLDAADVGYHFFVDERGQVWEGRDAGQVGTHVGSRPPGLNNPGNLGICGLGAYSWQEPPQVMVDRITSLTMLISNYYSRALIVRGHRDWCGINGLPLNEITCPGKLERAVVLAGTKMREAFPTGTAPANAPASAGASPAAASLPPGATVTYHPSLQHP